MDIQQLAGGLAIGSVYGSIALALVLIFRATGALNFAQGEMATFTTFIAWTLVVSIGLPYWVGFVITLLIALALGAAIERVAVRPLTRAPHLTLLIVTLGLFFLFNSLSLKFWGSHTRPFPSPFPEGSVRLLGAYVSWVSIGILGVSLIMMALLAALFRFTKIGLAMRAVTSNPTAALLMGINNNRILSLGWGLSAAVGAVAGMLAANRLLLDPNMMQGVLLYAFAAAVVGGMTSPVGAVIGGLAMGVINAVTSSISFIGADLSTAVTFVVIVLILVLRPAGLFGRPTAVRV
ncbi:MAG: branched-chain amino acid transporter permease [Mycobacterium sp.]|jgi:branched-chain amino acid transport system permease protein|nr:branched-chain amino acid transporter permease [Mycobacterium sp.]